MKISANAILVSSGYLPAMMFAKLLERQVVWLHRLAHNGRVVHARDGRALYVSARSLADYFKAGGAHPVADAVMELVRRVQEDVRLKEARLAIAANTMLSAKAVAELPLADVLNHVQAKANVQARKRRSARAS